MEDTKANNGELGQILITNLRLLWVSAKNKRVNISIGYGSISSTSIKNAASRIRGIEDSVATRCQLAICNQSQLHKRIIQNCSDHIFNPVLALL